MARTNVAKKITRVNHEGGRADAFQKPAAELERTVATCMLFENTFYEKGSTIAARIAELCTVVPIETIAQLAVKARNDYKLRHVPLFLVAQMDKGYHGKSGSIIGQTLSAVVQRPDEMGEFLSIYWKHGRKDGKNRLSKQIKKGLTDAFGKFSEYQFAKWTRDAAVKIRDVMFFVHPKPLSEQTLLYKQIAEDELAPADTWEVALSSGSDKKATWERLLSERKLGYMALLMNLRNMEQVHVDRSLIERSLLEGAPKSKALPFRFVAAANHAPHMAQTLSDAMLSALVDASKLKGLTLVVVDISPSMDQAKISEKSELTRTYAACALAVLLREVSESCRVFSFSNELVEVKNFRGLPLIREIFNSQQHNGTLLAKSLTVLKGYVPDADRVIVVTDEQSQDGNIPNWAKHGYICNVAPHAPGVETHGGWKRINGWSERLVDWIRVEENFEKAD